MFSLFMGGVSPLNIHIVYYGKPEGPPNYFTS